MNQMQSNLSFAKGLTKGIYDALRLWAHWKPWRILALLQRLRMVRQADLKRKERFAKDGVLVPPLIILSATMKCNLVCTGCYSRGYNLEDELTLEEIDALFTQAEEAGVAFFVITGGEPLMKPGLLDLLKGHSQLIFLLFTNGTFVTQAVANEIKQVYHIIPMLSVEGSREWTDERRGSGVYDQVMSAMDRLKKAGVFFGFSTVITSKNIDLVLTDTYYHNMISMGCGLGLLVGYVPEDARNDDPLLISHEQQQRLRQHVIQWQQSGRLILMQMPDDEYARGGVCMAAGRGFVHITAQGFVEPCPFSHYATHNFRESGLKACFDSPYFEHIRALPALKGTPHRGCALLEMEEELLAQSCHLNLRSTESSQRIEQLLEENVEE